MADADAIMQQLGVSADAEVVGGIVFQSITDLLENGVPDVPMLVEDVIYLEGLHLISGPPGHGKTSWVQWLCHSAMGWGKHIVWLDYEGGLGPTVKRLLEVGIPPSLAADRFHYASFPAEAEKHLVAVIERWDKPLIVVDSMSKALSYAGIDENDNAAVTAWTVPVVQAVKQHQTPVIIIDHVAKKGGDSEYSRGASAKLADVDVHWGVKRVRKFNRKTAGAVVCKAHKDRPGDLPFARAYRVGDGSGKLTFSHDDTILAGDEHAPDDETLPVI